MSKARNTLLITLVSAMVTTGCTQSTDSSVNSTPTSSQSEGALPLVKPIYPGPYQDIVVDGAELREGRYPVGKAGGTLVRPMVGHDPKVFNPWVASDLESSILSGLMFGGVVEMDSYTGDVVPSMASEFKVDPDGVTYTTKLRKGLKWSDGKPITAQDVAFTWNTLIAGGYGNSSLRDVTSIDGQSPKVTVVDELTNKYVTPKPFAPFLHILGIPIAPKHIIEPIIKGKDGRQAFDRLWSANLDPKTLVTSGPYVLSHFVPSQRVEFVPTKNFWMVNKDKKSLPYISKLIYQIIPDPNTMLLKFRAKEIDVAVIRPRDVVNLIPEQSKENFKLYNLGQSMNSYFMMFNLNRRSDPKTKKPYVTPYKSAWFNDLNFRQAVNHAINRQHLVDNVFKGIGFRQYVSMSPASPFFNHSLKEFPADINYSMSLLEKSGFKKRPDGFLYDKDGHKVEFDMMVPSGSSFAEPAAPMLVEDLKKLGMKVNLQTINFHTLGDRTGTSLNWEASMLGFATGDPLEPNNGGNVMRSDGRLHLFDMRIADAEGKVDNSDARPWEKRLDELYNLGAGTIDQAKRRAYYEEVQQIVYDQVPFIYLAVPMAIVGTRNTIGNYDPTPLSQSGDGLHNLEELYKK